MVNLPSKLRIIVNFTKCGNNTNITTLTTPSMQKEDAQSFDEQIFIHNHVKVFEKNVYTCVD